MYDFHVFEGYLKKIQVKNHQCLNKNKDSLGICIEFLTKHRIPIFDFFFYFSFFWTKKKVIVIFIRKSSLIKKIRRKPQIGIRSFVRNLMQIPKLSLFFFFFFFFSSIDNFWLLFFWRFKNAFYMRDKYIHIYMCIYWVLLGGFDAINESNQRTICSCMIFQP